MNKSLLKIFTLLFLMTSCNESQMRKGLKSYSNESDALANKSHVPVEITGQKKDSLLYVDITFLVQMVEFSEEDLLITNGRVYEFKGEGKNYKAIIQPITYGETTVIVPEGVAFHKITKKPNAASNMLTFHFTQLDIDKSLRQIKMPVGKVETFDPIKLILIVDNSSSMADNQESLSTSIHSSLNKLYGRNIEVFLYSTTQLTGKYDSSNRFSQKHLFTQKIAYTSYSLGIYPSSPTTRTWGQNQAGSFGRIPNSGYNLTEFPSLWRTTFFIKNQVSTLVDKDTFFDHDEIYEKYTIGPSAFDTKTIKLNAGMSRSEFDTALTRISSQVKLGTNGSREEFPLCTLLSVISNEGPHAIFKKGDRSAFIVLTDEDQSKNKCISEFRSKHIKEDFVPAYTENYKMAVTHMQVEVRQDKGSDTYISQTRHAYSTKDCMVNGSNICDQNRPCTAAEYTQYSQYFYDRNKVHFDSGHYRFPAGANSCNLYSYIHPSYAEVHLSKPAYVRRGTPCDQSNFDVKNMKTGQIQRITDKTLYEYIVSLNPKLAANGVCHYGVYSHKKTEGGLVDPAGLSEAGSLNNLIRNKADILLGRSNYMIAAIANMGAKNPAGCGALASSESVEVNEVADKGLVLSICDSYDKAFGWFDTFLKYKPETKYNLDPKVKEVVSVQVSSMDAPLMPHHYSFKEGTFEILPSSGAKLGDDITIIYR